MKREDLEHIVRSAALIADDVIVVVGSQAILAEIPDPPNELLASMEADLYPLNHTERADEIDGNIGEETMFARSYGYWAHGVGPETVASAPKGWEKRLVPLRVRGLRKNDPDVRALCMSRSDLMLSKLGAGRNKDVTYVEAAVRHGIVTIEELKAGLALLPKAVAWDAHRNPREIASRALSGIEHRLSSKEALNHGAQRQPGDHVE